MIYKTILLFICLLAVSLQAQTKPKTTRTVKKDTLHGTFKTYHKDGSLASVKHYDRGKRTGTWMLNSKLDSGRTTTIYKNDKIVRQFKISKTGDTILQIPKPNTLVKKKPVEPLPLPEIYVDEAGSIEIEAHSPVMEEGVYINTDEKALFKGGPEALANFLGRNLTYPESEKADHIEGFVMISFVIKRDSTISDVKVVNSSGNKNLDNEAMRVIKLSRGNWIPGKINGKPVSSFYKLPIDFTLKDE